jgi:hypothetical protein
MRKAFPSAMKDGSVIQRPIERLSTGYRGQRSPFAQRVWREVTRRRFCQAPRRVVFGDGAPWIWNIADDQFPEAVQIVDRFHAKQHLSDLGKALYGPASPRATQWAHDRKEELDAGKFPALLAAIRRQVSRSEEARRCLHYFQTNRDRMRYPQFRAQGLCTSTGGGRGRMQSRHCDPTQARRHALDRSRLQCHYRLRCSKLSGRFQDFWERRSEPGDMAA